MLKNEAVVSNAEIILDDYNESPYIQFESYWSDHTQHWLTELGGSMFAEVEEHFRRNGRIE